MGRIRAADSSSPRRNSGKIGLSTATRSPRSTTAWTASASPWKPPFVTTTRLTARLRALRSTPAGRDAFGPGVLERGNARPARTRAVASASSSVGRTAGRGSRRAARSRRCAGRAGCGHRSPWEHSVPRSGRGGARGGRGIWSGVPPGALRLPRSAGSCAAGFLYSSAVFRCARGRGIASSSARV